MTIELWDVKGERLVYEDRWVRLALAEVVLPDGRSYEYTALRRRAGAAVVALDGDNILLQQEYRYPLDAVIYQLPGGLVEEGEQPLATAQRELREETGYDAGEWRRLGIVQDNPGLIDGPSTLFLARQVRRVATPRRDDAEFLTFDWYSLAWLQENIAAGEIVDRVLLSAYAFLLSRRYVS